jgi:hypothetical protein
VYVARTKEMKQAYSFVRKSEAKRPLERSWRRQEDIIKVDFKDMG